MLENSVLISCDAGIAVQLSYTLGLHKTEVHNVFNEPERSSRYPTPYPASMSLFKYLVNTPSDLDDRVILWRNLYVIDRLLCAFSGRPPSIQDSDCSDPLILNGDTSQQILPLHGSFELEILSASVQSARILGAILNQMYRKREVSLQRAMDIAVDIHAWTLSLPPSLKNWDSKARQEHYVVSAQLHLWLMHFHSIVLLTRPFFLLRIQRIVSECTASFQTGPVEQQGHGADDTELNKYAVACVRSATRMIRAIQVLHDKGFRSQRNPLVM